MALSVCVHTRVLTHCAQTLLFSEQPGSALTPGHVRPGGAAPERSSCARRSQTHRWEGGRDTLLTEAGELFPVLGWLGKSFKV